MTAWGTDGYYGRMMENVARHYKVKMSTRVGEAAGSVSRRSCSTAPAKKKSSSSSKAMPISGTSKSHFQVWCQPSTAATKKATRINIAKSSSRSFRAKPCEACSGARLKPEVLAVRVGERNIDELSRLTLGDARAWFDALQLSRP